MAAEALERLGWRLLPGSGGTLWRAAAKQEPDVVRWSRTARGLVTGIEAEQDAGWAEFEASAQ